MKTIIPALSLFVLLLIPAAKCFSQFGGKDIDEYKASNGITYKIGDKVKLGIGSANNGSFNYVTMRNALFMDPGMSSRNNAHKSLAGKVAIIEKIKSVNSDQIYFVVSGLTAVRWALMIEEAISKCEITECKKESVQPIADKYDRLKKLKGLLDDGAITQAEYDKEKERILAEQ